MTRSEAKKKNWQDPEFRRRGCEATRLLWQDPAWRARVLAARKGKQSGENHPMFGKHHTAEARKKNSDAHKGLQVGENHPMYGRKQSEDSRKRMSESHKGVPLSELHRKSLGAASKRSWAAKSEEERKEWAQNISEGEKGKYVPPEARARISAAKKGKRCSPGTEFTSEKMKANYLDPAYVAKMKTAWNIKPNKAEVFLMDLLDRLYPGEWKYTGDFSMAINGKCPDFVNVSGQKKIIEYFGDHWHKGHCPGERAAAFSPFGYKTLVIWGREMKNLDAVIDRIHSFMEA